MHNLAIALQRKGYVITGSDDEIFEPSRSRLKLNGLLPEKEGWHPDKITDKIDAVILGMHARADNPELQRALKLGIRVMSFPEFIYDQTRDKKRIVVAGSHGKTTTTAMIMHVFKTLGIKFDFMVGSLIDGYDTMVGLSEDSEYAILEGDEYLTSVLDRRPKFHLYMPDIAVLNGIAWDHINVFPTFSDYVEQFRIFVTKISKGGSLIYFSGDPEVRKIAENLSGSIRKVPYRIHGHFQNKNGFYAATHNKTTGVKFFGEHNMQNLSAAREACLASGILEDDFYTAIQSFEGTAKRLQLLAENGCGAAFLDFAHSPSKVKATVDAVAERYPGHNIIACLELHTYSSLDSDFLPLYKGTLDNAAISYVYFNPAQFALKKLRPFSKDTVSEAFKGKNLKVFDNSCEMFSDLKERLFTSPVYLFMSSGDFDGMDIKSLSAELLCNK